MADEKRESIDMSSLKEEHIENGGTLAEGAGAADLVGVGAKSWVRIAIIAGSIAGGTAAAILVITLSVTLTKDDDLKTTTVEPLNGTTEDFFTINMTSSTSSQVTTITATIIQDITTDAITDFEKSTTVKIPTTSQGVLASTALNEQTTRQVTTMADVTTSISSTEAQDITTSDGLDFMETDTAT